MSRTIKINKYQVYDIVRNYHWKIKEVQRLKNELESVESSSTAQYGIEASMPKGSGVGRPVEAECARRERKRQRVMKYEEEIGYIIDRLDNVVDEKEQAMLDCLLDGYNVTAAGRHLGLSQSSAQRLYDDIVSKLAE
ncbi:DNA-binding response regulator [Pseudobacillus sp. FSL P4-0506]|uniref:DNA-binding response regulator n=1 Tax=Pseudobacillus sp. FSL P4-0506 TaxID=2921576 RepID=UPI0030FCAD20